MTAICIKPACGPNCDDCNHAITQVDAWIYVRRYAYLRNRDLDAIKDGGVFAGMTPDNAKVSGAGTASAGLPGWQANGETE